MCVYRGGVRTNFEATIKEHMGILVWCCLRCCYVVENVKQKLFFTEIKTKKGGLISHINFLHELS